jgi:hypothetical protein
MKKVLIGTTLAVFALAPAMSFADCSEAHTAAAMASAAPAGKSTPEATVAGKTAPPVVAKATVTKAAKQPAAAAPQKTSGSTVVAKSN